MARPGQKDPYGVRAKEEGYPARSVYKLKEIQDKYKLIRAGQRIVDLGCHPGSWLRFCSQSVGTGGLVLGLDVKEPTIPLSPNILFLQADLLTVPDETIKTWAGRADVVLSDLSPKTSGIKWLDHQRSLDLNLRALEIGFLVLIKGGSVVLKIFDGQGTKNFIKKMKDYFEQVQIHKPKSSRSESSEIYLIGQRFKG
ncbi:MAG: RlmE family RNA methyltransferase [Deltaproteobacteria bacterium]|nr:RlmE family RNA methyltransferase [Deltaproteobacteria bacterium]